MRVYYRVNNQSFESLSSELYDVADMVSLHILQKFKYRVMWELRELDNEITEEGGIIIVTIKGFETKDFTPELTERIKSIISSVNWEIW
jgi:hypothetical protein